MIETERNKELTRRFFAALNTGKGEALLELFADDGKTITMGTTPISGTYDMAAMRKASKEILGAFPTPLKITLLGMVAEGDKVAAEGESHGQHVSGAFYNNHYHFLLTFRDGKVVEFKEYMDTQHAIDVLCGGRKALG